jgi:aldose 1-epimerase
MSGERIEDGLRALTLTTADGALEATFVPAAGMVGCSLRHRGEELLGQREGLRSYAADGGTMGIPLLHPWANRIARTRFAVAGGEVALDPGSPRLQFDPNGLPIHGLLAAARGWRVESHEPAGEPAMLRAHFEFAAHPDLIAAFPFPHQVLCEITLGGDTLRIETTVRATGEVSVPIAFGYHPYFRLPGTDRADWRVEIPVRERLELDGLMLPTGGRKRVEPVNGVLGKRTFDDGYLSPPGGRPFVLGDDSRRIEVSFEAGYPFAQVYAPVDDDVVAYEPMTAPTNALVSGEDLPLVAPGKEYRTAFAITVIEERTWTGD